MGTPAQRRGPIVDSSCGLCPSYGTGVFCRGQFLSLANPIPVEGVIKSQNRAWKLLMIMGSECDTSSAEASFRITPLTLTLSPRCDATRSQVKTTG